MYDLFERRESPAQDTESLLFVRRSRQLVGGAGPSAMARRHTAAMVWRSAERGTRPARRVPLPCTPRSIFHFPSNSCSSSIIKSKRSYSKWWLKEEEEYEDRILPPQHSFFFASAIFSLAYGLLLLLRFNFQPKLSSRERVLYSRSEREREERERVSLPIHRSL